jgi:hypothetical protein
MESADRLASVYALASPASVVAAEDGVRRALFALLGVSDTERHRVRVSPASGWIEYADVEALWGERPRHAFPEPTSARDRAEAFLRDLRATFAALPRVTGDLDPRALLPPLAPVECTAVPDRSGRGWDHCLYRAQPRLPVTRGGRSVDVIGTHVEVRVGDGGRVVGLMSRWRPLSGERTEAELAHPPADKRSHGTAEPALVYVLDGDGVPQYYLAPYYLMPSEHGGLTSACAYALTVELVVRPLPDDPGARVTAVVAGGSHRYRFAWARQRMEGSDDDEGFVDLGEVAAKQVQDDAGRVLGASAVSIPPGAWIVFVNVKDVATGAFKHYQEIVFTGRVVDNRSEA